MQDHHEMWIQKARNPNRSSFIDPQPNSIESWILQSQPQQKNTFIGTECLSKQQAIRPKGEFNFVWLADGQIKISRNVWPAGPIYQQLQLAENADKVLGAGTVQFDFDGNLIAWNNLSCDYFATAQHYEYLYKNDKCIFDFQHFNDASTPRNDGNSGSIELALQISQRHTNELKTKFSIEFDDLNPVPSYYKNCLALIKNSESLNSYHLISYLDFITNASKPTKQIPAGEYIFVRMLNGQMRCVSREEGNNAHISSAGAATRVMYAGVAAFEKDSSGRLIWWTNRSSGYPGLDINAGLAGFPLNESCFRPYNQSIQETTFRPGSAPTVSAFPLSPPSFQLKRSSSIEKLHFIAIDGKNSDEQPPEHEELDPDDFYVPN